MTDLSGLHSVVGADAARLIDQVLEALSSLGPHQHTRLLRLHTPLGADVLLAERAEVCEHISPQSADWLGFRIELLALSTQAHLAPADLIGQPVLLELLTAHSRTELRPFHGHVTRFELLGSDGGLARYRLVIEPFTAFMQHRVDAWAYQGLSVQGVVDQLINDYAGQGALTPQVRWELANPAAYPTLSIYNQHAETDLAFLQRTLSLYGLFCWFEHTGDTQDTRTLGRHTLVIADHPGALQPNAQAQVRFTQAGTVLKDDSITQWHGRRRVGPTDVSHSSWDYRVVDQHSARLSVDAGHEQAMPLQVVDQPGAYTFENPVHAQQAATHRLQSLASNRKRYEGLGTVRTLAPATTFALHDHPEHDAESFVVLGVTHTARNNLHADVQAGLQHLLGHLTHVTAIPTARAATRNHTDEPLYQARFATQRADVPVRPAPWHFNAHTRVQGVQTALVVGLEAPVHTDRDGRIKVQFHWQRGAQASHRLSHPTTASEADNAPASDASGTWVRVAQPWAGANWGGVFTPRLGQEVLVAFVDGDVDRPVVIGSAYNGQGQPEAPGNAVAHGTAQATGNAPAWFPGSQRQGHHEGHAHTASLSGFKSQSLDASQDGSGAHNQLVLDDTPGQGRVMAHTTQHQTWLQMGHLLQQGDNLRLAQRGHGLELNTRAQGAVRAGSGLHISTFARTGGTTSPQGQPTNTREAQQQLQAHAQLLQSLGDNAQTHLAKLPGEAAAPQLPAHQGLQATLVSLKGTQASGGGGGGHTEPTEGQILSIDGGHGTIPAPERPDLVLSAAGTISSATPAHTVVSTGAHTTLTSAQDTNSLSQRHSAWAVKGGISLFTRGEAKDAQRAVQDVGLRMHAASGNVNTQAQSSTFSLTAKKAIDLQSTTASIVISAPQKIVLNGGGGYLKIEGGNIEIGTSGPASFKGAMKELAGGGANSQVGLSLIPPGALALGPKAAPDVQFRFLDDDGQPMRNAPYTLIKEDGTTVEGHTDDDGKTAVYKSQSPENCFAHLLNDMQG